MHRKDSLDADSVRNFPDRESGAVCAPINLDHDALEGLDALLLAFDDLDVNANPIADAEFGQVLAEPPLFELLDNGIHGKKDLSRAPKPTEMRASTQYHARKTHLSWFVSALTRPSRPSLAAQAVQDYSGGGTY